MRSHTPRADVSYVQAGTDAPGSAGRVEGPPDIAVEIVSHDSVDRDYELKREMYEAAGVPGIGLSTRSTPRRSSSCSTDGKYQPAVLEEGVRFRSRRAAWVLARRTVGCSPRRSPRNRTAYDRSWRVNHEPAFR